MVSRSGLLSIRFGGRRFYTTEGCEQSHPLRAVLGLFLLERSPASRGTFLDQQPSRQAARKYFGSSTRERKNQIY